MEKGLTKKKVQSFGIQQPRLFNSPKDFFILSLSISTGLLFFTIFLYIIIKISSFDFGSNKQKDSFEGEGQNLDSLDDLLQDEEEVVEGGEEVVKQIDGGEEVVKQIDGGEEEERKKIDGGEEEERKKIDGGEEERKKIDGGEEERKKIDGGEEPPEVRDENKTL